MLLNGIKDTIVDPYVAIDEFFQYGSVAHFTKMIRHVLKAAESEKVYKKRDHSEIVYEFEFLESIVDAAWNIRMTGRSNPFLLTGDEIPKKKEYYKAEPTNEKGLSFPQFLSRKEYIDPLLMLKRFFLYRAVDVWKEDLREILSFAFSKNRISDGTGNIILLFHYIFLNKLLEAVDLIRVRAGLKRKQMHG